MKVITSTFKEFTKKKKNENYFSISSLRIALKAGGLALQKKKKKNSGINTTFAIVVRIALS